MDCMERYELSTERIKEIKTEEVLKDPYLSYFKTVSDFALNLWKINELKQTGELCKLNLDEAKAWNRLLFSDILEENYEKSYANPEYAYLTAKNNAYNVKVWKYLCYLYTQLRGLIPYAYEGDTETLTLYFELFIQVYGILTGFEEDGSAPEKEIFEALYWFERDNLECVMAAELEKRLDPENDFALRLIMDSDLSSERYLYDFGEYISENERGLVSFLNSLPKEDIAAMAKTYTEGYRIGFEKAGKPLERKISVNIRYQLGFEPVVREAVKQFEDMGLKAVIYRSSTLAGGLLMRARAGEGYSSTPANRQYDYDHREDRALYFDREYSKRRIDILKRTYEKKKKLANGHAGPAVIETFGEKPFSPKAKEQAIRFDEKGQKLWVSYSEKAGRLANEYIIGEERSFTIIAYPIPEIGPEFGSIFRETVKLNTLDYRLYESIQQKMIDVLNTAGRVHVKGKNGNDTDITVELFKLSDPEKEAIFENCVADVNIPVGEIFTSPVLKGTNGLLHVKEVFLNGLKYKDLRLWFKDGMIEDYSCKNFDSEEENRKYIRENLLFHHDTLPIGEFAIGTNTTAYRMSKDYGIEERLPILIGEKTGPHFAIGDTCYCREEEVRVYNPDGKEIVAKSNAISDMRKSDPEKAYFFCHTDITIPYDDLKHINAVYEDGSVTAVIEDGLFVLKGTEELNTPLLA
ncbi:MAG: aminopeptidase [Lachnospiraceae bacterium]|nr:aminopeptidase [Lachnospiraceae bacterium]